jgi:hypothetical protein
MSEQGVESVIRRAVVDAEYRTLLLNNPSVALAGYDLCEHEVARFSGLDPTVFDVSESQIEDRISRAGETGCPTCQFN